MASASPGETGQVLPGQAGVQPLAVEQLHDEEDGAVFGAAVVEDPHHARVVDGVGHAGLLLEPAAPGSGPRSGGRAAP